MSTQEFGIGESGAKYGKRRKKSPARVEDRQAKFNVVPCEKVLGRTEGRTYHVTGPSAPLGYFVKLHTIKPGTTWDRTNELGNTVYDRNSEEDVYVEVAMAPVVGIENGRKVTEGDVDDWDDDETRTFRGTANLFYDPELSELPEDATWYVADH